MKSNTMLGIVGCLGHGEDKIRDCSGSWSV